MKYTYPYKPYTDHTDHTNQTMKYTYLPQIQPTSLQTSYKPHNEIYIPYTNLQWNIHTYTNLYKPIPNWALRP